MVRRVTGPTGLDWKIKRLVVPTGFLPLTRGDVLAAGTPRRTIVGGMDRQVQDAVGAPTGPLPLGFLFIPLWLPLIPIVLLLRKARIVSWTVEARAYPWGRRYPPIVLAYLVRGGDEAKAAVEELTAALARGDGAPELVGAVKIGQQASPHDRGAPIVSHKSKRF
jgi:hypothetical protein